MPGKNLSEEPDESFVLKKVVKTSQTRSINLEIHDFRKEIDNAENTENGLESPIFKIVDTELSISIYPNDALREIGMYLNNKSQKDIRGEFSIKTKMPDEEVTEGLVQKYFLNQ